MPKAKPAKKPTSARMLKNRPPETEEQAEKIALGEPLDFDEKPGPKQKRLPAMEDAAIEELEDAAERYAGIRDKRMALTEQEVDCQELLLTLMKRNGKKHYKRDGIECTVVAKEEKVRVKIKKDEE